MQLINMNTWPRREIFDHYSRMNHPFFSVTFKEDVTPLYRYTKARGLSFYHALVWLCARAINEIEDFRYTLRDGRLYLMDARVPAFTDMPPGSELFHIVTLPCGDTMEDFCRAAKEQNATQTFFIDETAPPDTVLHCSCLPWVEMTGLSSARHFDPEDASPWVTWGKFVTEGDRKMLGMCLELNHRFHDGFHVGAFHQTLNRLMAEL